MNIFDIFWIFKNIFGFFKEYSKNLPMRWKDRRPLAILDVTFDILLSCSIRQPWKKLQSFVEKTNITFNNDHFQCKFIYSSTHVINLPPQLLWLLLDALFEFDCSLQHILTTTLSKFPHACKNQIFIVKVSQAKKKAPKFLIFTRHY